MKLRTIGVVYRKELLDTLRDRRTLFSAIIVPILLFPIMTLGFGSIASRLIEQARQEAASVMLLGEEHAPSLAALLRETDGLGVVEASDDYVERINDKELRAAVEFSPDFEASLLSDTAAPPTITIYHYTGELRSQFAVRSLQRVIREYRIALVEAHLARNGLQPDVLRPFQSTEENVASAEKVGGNLLGRLLPYMIIILCLTGALYPAMDLTAGEKERGTIETILATPAARSELVLGKFLLVLTASIVTAVLALGSFAITLSASGNLVRRLSENGVPFAISLKAVGSVFLLVLPLAVMFSAALMAISLLAKSFKEAQSYIQPLMIVAILPAIAAMLPGVELNTRLALVPILNVSLVSKEIFTGSYPWDLILLIFGSSCVYAAAALFVAVRQFHREEVLFRT